MQKMEIKTWYNCLTLTICTIACISIVLFDHKNFKPNVVNNLREINFPIGFCVHYSVHIMHISSQIVCVNERLTYRLKCSTGAIWMLLKSKRPDYSINHNMFVQMAIYFF